ncbi:hypothetical protein [Nostoc sp.]|uniref:hypothetical protein n=1 Tax=Nostoc sp. TaxID=1180 RepID=UPI002FFA2C3C
MLVYAPLDNLVFARQSTVNTIVITRKAKNLTPKIKGFLIAQASSSPLFWLQEAQPHLLCASSKNFLVLRSEASISSNQPYYRPS